MKTDKTIRTVTVRQTMPPYGTDRAQPPSLGQLRLFVEECDGLPDNTPVSLEKTALSESGRYDYIFTARLTEEVE